jgi:sugar-specific transcriptional regulator TrmB
MSKQTDTQVNNLIRFGLTKEDSLIYLYLLEKGKSTALSMSKELHLGRTKVYRILDTLYSKNLVRQKVGERGFVFEACDPEQLKLSVIEKASEVEELESLLPFVIDDLGKVVGGSGEPEEAKVRYYKGEEGLRQVTWNSLKASKQLLVYEMVPDLSEFLNPLFSEKVRKELVKRRIQTRQITNFKKIPKFTQTAGFTKYWTPKHIDPKTLKLSYEVLIYNDVVAMYNVRASNVFCVEIHDKYLAKMQKQMFNFVWKQSGDMEKINTQGEAVLKG